MIYIKEATAKVANRNNLDDYEWVDFIDYESFHSFKAFLDDVKEGFEWDDVVVLETSDMPDEYSDNVFDKELGVDVVEISDDFFKLLNEMNERAYDYSKMDAFSHYCDDIKHYWDISLLDEFEHVYEGEYDSEEDFCASQFCENFNVDNLSFDLMEPYIDFEKLARDWFIDDYQYYDGFVFRNE